MSTVEAKSDGKDKALNEIVAHRLSQIPSVVSFRGEVLNGGLLKPENVDAWWLRMVASEEDESNSAVEVYYEVEVGDEGDIDLGWSYRVRRTGVLGRLHKVAEELVSEHCDGWSLGQAVGFVLTNQPPFHYATVEVVRSSVLPEACTRIKLVLDPNMSIKEVAEIYATYRNILLKLDRNSERRNKPMTSKHLALAVFTEKNRGSGTWNELREKWNLENPREWHYTTQNTWNFARDAKKAWERVTGDKFEVVSRGVGKDESSKHTGQ